VEILQGLHAGDQLVSGQGQSHSRWRKDGAPGGAGSNRRGQMMMMMRGLGGGRR